MVFVPQAFLDRLQQTRSDFGLALLSSDYPAMLALMVYVSIVAFVGWPALLADFRILSLKGLFPNGQIDSTLTCSFVAYGRLFLGHRT